MKRGICILLAVILLCGCGKNKDNIQTPVNFYYVNGDISYNSLNGVISAEVRDGSGYQENLVGLLDLYLSGPASGEFRSPFPIGTVTIDTFLEDTVLIIELSKEFAELSGLDLTVACACLMKTATELTGCDCVQIYVTNELLDGNPSVTMEPDDLIFLDAVTEPEI